MSLEEVVAAARSSFSPDDLVWAEGRNTWRAAHSVSGLFPAMPLLPAKPMGADPAMRMLLPVGRSFWAIASGYFGLLSILLVFAPFALITGILAIMDIKKKSRETRYGSSYFRHHYGSVVQHDSAFCTF